jgi:ABC-type antimicrobial peptide transport system permease subunit
VEGHEVIDDLPDGGPFLYSGTEGFFETIGVTVTRGRAFELGEFADGAEPVGMISETFARTIWPDTNPMAHCFRVGADHPTRAPEPCRRIVGVFRDFARTSLSDTGTISVAIPGQPGQGRSIQAIVVRTKGLPADVIPSIRQVILDVSSDVRFVSVSAMADRFDRLLQPWKLGATMLSAFGLIALAVAVTGLYSSLAFDVAQHKRELGIRAALGATRPRLIWVVMRQAGTLVIAGLAIGTTVALASTRLVEGLLFGVTATDASVYVLVVLVLGISGILAALAPAWSVTKVKPATALESE